MLSFITNADFLVLYDGRWVAKNVLDDGSAPSVSDLADPSSDGGAVLAALIAEASEMVMAACAVGKRYQISDLVTYGGSLLIRIVSDLAMGLVLKRRGRALTDEDALSKSYSEALGYLEQLRRGERIFFNVPLVPEAGLLSTGDMNPRPGIDPPLVTQVAARYFGFPVGWNPGYGRWFGGFGGC